MFGNTASRHRLFNVTSTFDENLYTTPLNKNALTTAQMAHAERMAAEIEGKTSSNIHMREERNMVSDVRPYLDVCIPRC